MGGRRTRAFPRPGLNSFHVPSLVATEETMDDDERHRLHVEKHRAEKQRSRDEDARRLTDGEVTRGQLARENGLFPSPIISNIRIVSRFGRKSEPPQKK